MANVCWWCSGCSAITTQSTSTPGIFTCRGFSPWRSAMRSTWTITMPPELWAAGAMERPSSVSASFSMVTLPAGSAVGPRRVAAGMGVDPGVLPVAWAGGGEQGEVGGASGGQEALLQRDGEPFGEAGAAEPAGRDGVAVADEADGIGSGDDLAGGGSVSFGDLGV